MKACTLLCALVGPVLANLALASAAFAGEIPAPALDDPQSFAGAAVVLLGEVHDNPRHHANQARAVAALLPKALVFEMLPPGVARPADTGQAADMAAALGWDAAGWPDFAMYYPIFTAAPEARLYGAEVPRDAARRAIEAGVAEVFGPDATTYGLTSPLPKAEQTAREAEQMQAHCNALPADLLPGMVAVQRLRDASLARAVVQAMADTGGPVAVITGAGHARKDQGVPAVLARVAPELPVLSIGQFEDPAPPDPPFDLWLITAPEPRPDPCEAFSKG